MRNRSANAFAAVLLGAIVSSAPAAISVVGSMTQKKTAQPGETYQGSILIKNDAKEPREAKVYQTDYAFKADGRNVYGEPGANPRSNASWISFSPRRLAIPAGGTAVVRYKVNVPAERALSGTYWSLLMVEDAAPSGPAPDDRGQPDLQVGLKSVLRYGIQIVTDIGNTGTRKVRFENARLQSAQGRCLFSIDVENVGESWLRPVMSAELFDASGKRAGQFKGAQVRIFPGTSVRVNIDFGFVQKGRYKAVIIADNGDEHIFGTQVGLTL